MRKLLILLAAVLCLISAASAETLIISADITTIGTEAFCDLAAFDEVILPEGLISIGDRAFAGSTIKRVYLPASLKSIGSDAFMDGTVGYGPAGTWAGEWFNAQENLVYEADYGTPEKADDSVWDEIRLEEAWCVYPDGKLHAGDLGALCARWLVWPLTEEDSSVLTVHLCRDAELIIQEIPRQDIARFDFMVDVSALPKMSGASIVITEVIPEGTISTGDPKEIINYLVKPVQKKTTSSKSGKSGTAVVRIVHAKEQHQTDHGYDQLGLNDLAEGVTTPMTVLTLSGEEENLSLTRNGEPAWFIPVLLSWNPQEEETEDALNTLLLDTGIPESVLAAAAESSPAPAENAGDVSAGNAENTAAAPGAFQWVFGGDLLRKLNRSNIEYLALKTGEQIIVFPTEGFLAGEAYDRLKSAGTASRRFIYTVSAKEPEDAENAAVAEAPLPVFPEISVSAADENFPLAMEKNAPMYMRNVLCLPGSAMEVFVEESADR